MQQCAVKCDQIIQNIDAALNSQAGKTGQVHRSLSSTVSRLRQQTGREIVSTQIFMNVHPHTRTDRSLMCLPRITPEAICVPAAPYGRMPTSHWTQ